MNQKLKFIILIFLINLCFTSHATAKIFVLIGPSGVGKSSIIKKFHEKGFRVDEIISHTTRPMRIGEINGKDYFFISIDNFKEKELDNEFIISTQVHGNWYGISKEFIEEKLEMGGHLFCSLNTEAAKKIKNIFGERVVTIFVAPPSMDELKKRLYERNTEDEEILKVRLRNAYNELEQQDSFDYKIINNDLEESVDEFKTIFLSDLIINQHVNPLEDIETVRAISYNIRMAPFAEDDATENAWVHRLPKIQMILDQYMPDIIGLQEMSLSQKESLEKTQNRTSYRYLGKYPSRKPFESGLGIVYNSEKLRLISDLCTVWLNESQVNSEGSAWDGSSYERYVIYAKFKNLATGNDFWFMTTHFDHLGIKARQESAKIVMDLAERLDAPAVVTGDFNCFPQLGGQELYQLLCSRSMKMKDSGNIAQVLFGVPGSWMGWDYDFYKQREGYSKYDFIFVWDSIEVIQHGIIDDRVWDDHFQKELYPSDHRPVISDLRI